MLDIPWYVYALIGAFVVSLSALIEKRTLKTERPLECTSGVLVTVGILSLPLLYFVDWSVFTPTAFLILAFVSVTNVLGYWLVAKAMRQLGVGEVSVLLAFVPITVAGLAFPILGEALSDTQIFGIVISVVGVLILEAPHIWSLLKKSAGVRDLVCVGFVLIAVALYTLDSLLDRVALAHMGINPLDYIVVVQTMSLGLLITAEEFMRTGRRSYITGIRRTPASILLIALLLFTSRILHAEATALAFAALANVLKRSSVIISIILSGAFFKERGIGRKLTAGIFILAGTALLILM